MVVLTEVQFGQGVVILTLIFNSFYVRRLWWSLKKVIFNSFYIGLGVVVLKELILTVSTLGGVGLEGVVILKELIFNSFYF